MSGVGRRVIVVVFMVAVVVLWGLAWELVRIEISRNERWAQKRMRAIVVAQRQYLLRSPRSSYAGSLEQLRIPVRGCAEHLPPEEEHGYRFRVLGLAPLAGEEGETVYLGWCAVAWPTRFGITGRRIFYADHQVDPTGELPWVDLGQAVDMDVMSARELLEFLAQTWPDRMALVEWKEDMQ